jgi:hypothetical protein
MAINEINKPIVLCTPLDPTPPCCPELSYADGRFKIDDDYGQSITLDRESINQIVNDLDKIISMPRSSLDN